MKFVKNPKTKLWYVFTKVTKLWGTFSKVECAPKVVSLL